MINQSTSEIFYYLNISFKVFTIFLVFLLLIVVSVSTIVKEIEPDCKKGFSKGFIIFLIFLMFSTILDLFWESNKSIAFIPLTISMEVYFFNKKSKWKFGILSILLLCVSFILMITEIIYFYLAFSGFSTMLGYYIASVVVAALTSLNSLTIGIVILVLFKETTKENKSLKTCTRPISIGVIFLLIITPLFLPVNDISSLNYIIGETTSEINFWFNQGVYLLTLILFIIGITVLSVGAIKTMSIPLNFSSEKGMKGIPRKSTKICPKCGVFNSFDVQICLYCGNKI